MKFNFKKISAVLASGIMVASGIGFAAAASFPAPFSDGQAAGTAIVYSSNAAMGDTDAVTSINGYLKTKVKSDGAAPEGESVKFEKASTKFELGYGIFNVSATAVTDSSPNGGLPTLLAGGKFLDDDNDEFDYTQKIDMANLNLTMFDDNDYKEDAPTVGFRVASGKTVLNYTLEFTDYPLWADLATADLPLLGKKYYVLSETVNTTLTLLDSAVTETLAETEIKTVTVGETPYEVTLDFIGSSTVKFNVNGELTNTLSAGQTYHLSDGSYIVVREINTQDYAGGTKRVEFSIGKGKLKLSDSSDIELNDNAITDFAVNFTSGTEKLQKIKLTWKAEDDSFITEDSSLTMPGFGLLKLSSTGMTYPKEEKIVLEQSSDTAVVLNDFPLKDGPADINLVYGNNSDWLEPGKDATHVLRTTNNTLLNFDKDTDEYFVASYDDGTNAESYLLRATDFKIDNAVNKTTFQYYDGDTSTWSNIKENAKDADVITRGSVEFTVNTVNKAAKAVNFTAGTNVYFNRLYSKEGLKVFLPYNNETSAATGGLAPGVINRSAGSGGPDTLNIAFYEEDKNENIGAGGYFNATLGWDSSSTPEAEVSDIVGESITFEEIGDTDVWRSIMYSPLATELLWNKPSGSQKSLTAVYHGAEAYGNLYLTSASATTSTVGNMLFKDNEKASWQDRNVVLVGGSCINTATAEKLGGAKCADEFATVTGVGAGKFLIQTFDGFTTGKVAVVVAGYEATDTLAAANYLKGATTLDTTVGKKYVGTVAQGGTSTVVAA